MKIICFCFLIKFYASTKKAHLHTLLLTTIHINPKYLHIHPHPPTPHNLLLANPLYIRHREHLPSRPWTRLLHYINRQTLPPSSSSPLYYFSSLTPAHSKLRINNSVSPADAGEAFPCGGGRGGESPVPRCLLRGNFTLLKRDINSDYEYSHIGRPSENPKTCL